MKKFLRIRIGPLFKPSLDHGPDFLEWINASSPASWSSGLPPVRGTNLTIAPGRRQTFDETVQFLAGLGGFLVSANLTLYELSLSLTNLIQELYGVQREKCVAK